MPNEREDGSPGRLVEIQSSFTVLARFENASREADRQRSALVPATALAVTAVSSQFFSEADRARHALRRRIQELAEGPARNRDNDGPTTINLNETLWELFDAHGYHSAFVLESLAIPLQQAIDGTSESFPIAYWSSRTRPFPPVRLVCHATSFESGSLKTTLKALATGTTLMLTLAGTPLGHELYAQLRVHQEITSVYAGERCLTDTTFQIDGKAVLDATAEELNFQAPALSAVERARSVCLVQLALTLNGYRVGPLDGRYGPSTQTQLSAFMGAHKLHGDITTPMVRQELARALHVGARELVKK